MTGAERRARRWVDNDHYLARNLRDPLAFLRKRQAEAEAHYARSGHADDLALVRAYERSLDGQP